MLLVGLSDEDLVLVDSMMAKEEFEELASSCLHWKIQAGGTTTITTTMVDGYVDGEAECLRITGGMISTDS